MNSDYHFITDFTADGTPQFRADMGKLEKIRIKVAKLQVEAKELKRLRADYDNLKRFRKMLVNERFD